MKKSKSIDMRAMIWLGLMVAACGVVAGRLFYMQYIEYDKYQSQVIDNIQQESTIPAERGDIYDRHMNVLATNMSTYRLFVSPVDIQEAGTAKAISTYLAEFLDLDYDTVYQKTQRENMKDITIEKNLSEAQAEVIRTYITDHDYKTQIYLESTDKRYYPQGALASSVIGAMGTDGGLFGLELQYNTYLTGTPGRYITTRNGQSQSMPTEYDQYVEAKDGVSAVTTLDVNIQSMLEAQLKAAYEFAQAKEKVSGIVMNPNTGEIYGMATYPTFDLNDMYTLNGHYQTLYDNWTFDPSKYKEGTTEEEARNEYYWECVYAMWNNKAVSMLYEPGSTMKMMTTAMALEEKVTTFADTYSCSGALRVGGHNIHCHKRSGHGTNTFNRLLQFSCNPTIMSVAARLGSAKFYSYFEAFGYTSITGVDLPGEEKGLYVNLSGFNAVELACYSFGQTFKTTPLQQITAVSTIANGGYLVTPHIVSSLVDANGNTQVSFGTEIKRQVVSSDVCSQIMAVLEDGVSSGNGVKNAYVAGYKVAAKTGTSEKRDVADKTARIGSCVAVAPADDPQVCIIIMVDEPQISPNLRYGATVAAPYVGTLMEQVLGYLGVERQYNDDEMARLNITIDDYTGTSLARTKEKLDKLNLQYEVIGDGDTVTKQIPAAGEILTNVEGKVYLYTGGATADRTIEVPDLVDKPVTTAITTLHALGFNVHLEGVTNYATGTGATVLTQSPAAGTQLPYGSVVTLECRYLNETD